MMVCRLSYVVWMLEELIHKIPSSADVCIMYDIACTFSTTPQREESSTSVSLDPIARAQLNIAAVERAAYFLLEEQVQN